MDRAFFDAAAIRIKQTFTPEIDRNLPLWARRTNPIVRRDLGSYWKTLTPDLALVLRVYLAQVVLIVVSFAFPALFIILMPTVTVTLVLLPIGIAMYAQALYGIGAAAATSVSKERSHSTLDLLLIIPQPTLHTLLSKVAASIWRQTENLSLIIMGAALVSLPLLVIQYDVFLSFEDNPVLMRVGLVVALGVTILRILLEPVMIGALGALAGAALPSRIPAIVATVGVGGAYFILINLARLAPLDAGERVVVEIVLPVVLPLVISTLALLGAVVLLRRE
ncbi:MAG: hypothetical protein U0521_23460 [Anaerolineae bacterium]